jgi:hypothetical protein
MEELKKNGRVFFAGDEGHVCELIFNNYQGTWRGILMK